MRRNFYGHTTRENAARLDYIIEMLEQAAPEHHGARPRRPSLFGHSHSEIVAGLEYAIELLETIPAAAPTADSGQTPGAARVEQATPAQTSR